MTPVEIAIPLIQEFEGYKDKPYLCGAGRPTIGWGTTIYPSGLRVTLKDPPCTKEQAQEWLVWGATRAEKTVDRLVDVPLSANQTAALISFVYNLGAMNLSASTLLMKLNKGDYDGAAGEFTKWVLSKGVPSNGLVRRRSAELSLFLKKP